MQSMLQGTHSCTRTHVHMHRIAWRSPSTHLPRQRPVARHKVGLRRAAGAAGLPLEGRPACRRILRARTGGCEGRLRVGERGRGRRRVGRRLEAVTHVVDGQHLHHQVIPLRQHAHLRQGRSCGDSPINMCLRGPCHRPSAVRHPMKRNEAAYESTHPAAHLSCGE